MVHLIRSASPTGEDARIRLNYMAEVQNEFLRWSRGAINAYVDIPGGRRGKRPRGGSGADASTFPGVLTKFYEAR